MKRYISLFLTFTVLCASLVFSLTATALDATNLVMNGDFSKATTGWEIGGNSISVSEAGYSGNGLVITSAWHETITQTVTVTANTNYKLSFYYKGTTPKDACAFGVSKDTTLNNSSVILKDTIPSVEAWTQYETIFSSGANAKIVLVFQSTPECEYYIDEITLTQTTDTVVEYIQKKDATFNGCISGSGYSSSFLTCAENYSLVENGGFEYTSAQTGKPNTSSLLGEATSIISDEQFVFEGNSALKFEADSTEKIATVNFDVLPNTTYYVTMFMKAMDYDAQNHSKLSFGITSVDTGMFIPSNQTIKSGEEIDISDIYITKMSPAAYDSQWHMVGGTFTTNDETKVAFTIRGENATAYIDNLAIFIPKGKEVLGIKNPYWNLAKKWTVSDSGITFDSVKYSSEGHQFVLSLRLDTILKAGTDYTINSDFAITNWLTASPDSLNLYYSPSLDNADYFTQGQIASDATLIYSHTSDFRVFPKNSFTFIPENDLYGGYITLRIRVKDSTKVNMTFSEISISNSSGIIDNWDFSGFKNGTYLGTGTNFSESQLKNWFSDLDEYSTDVSLLTSEEGRIYETELQNLEHAALTNLSPELLGTATENNLIDNYDFSDSDMSFWENTNGSLLGDNLNIVNTGHIVQGKAMHYENNRLYPRGIYYIKWVDVKPNTEYTFSARYAILETGGGFFGIIDGYRTDVCTVSENLVFPQVIGTIDFSEENYLDSLEWQSSGFSFNTMDRNRVGFVVLDKGGSAYIDDIRLFETANSTELEIPVITFPESITFNNSDISVVNGIVRGIEQESTVSVVRNYINEQEYVKFYSVDGNELSEDDLVGTGTVIKLANGQLVKDILTVAIRGDLNGDASVNALDLALMRKYLLQDIVLDGVNLVAADTNPTEGLDIRDLVALKKLVVSLDDTLRIEVGSISNAEPSGTYNLTLKACNFDTVATDGGAYYFALKLPDILSVKGVTFDGTQLAPPDYENGTGEYSVDENNALILCNMFNTGGADDFQKYSVWNITVQVDSNAEIGSYPILLDDTSFVIDLEENIINYNTKDGVINIK